MYQALFYEPGLQEWTKQKKPLLSQSLLKNRKYELAWTLRTDSFWRIKMDIIYNFMWFNPNNMSNGDKWVYVGDYSSK